MSVAVVLIALGYLVMVAMIAVCLHFDLWRNP